MWAHMIAPVQEVLELPVNLGERGNVVEVAQEPVAQGPPEAIHLAARLGIVGFGVQQRDLESGACPGAREAHAARVTSR